MREVFNAEFDMTAFTFENVAILGLVEGVTEFIPVSSTGHLILAGEFLGLQGEAVHSFEIFIQTGAILAVVLLYWKRFKGLFDFSKKDNKEGGFTGAAGIWKLAAASIPAFITGGFFASDIKRVLFSPYTVALALIVGAVLMVFAEFRKGKSHINSLEEISCRKALLIGIFQCLALWPGMSRSACTIVGGMFLGLERKIAAEFSFLAAAPVIVGATVYDLSKSWRVITVSDLPLFAVGFVVSMISAFLAIKFFISLLGRWTLTPFALYRIVLGLIVLVVLT